MLRLPTNAYGVRVLRKIVAIEKKHSHYQQALQGGCRPGYADRFTDFNRVGRMNLQDGLPYYDIEAVIFTLKNTVPYNCA